MDKKCMLTPRSVDLTTAVSEMDSVRTVENSTFYRVTDRTWLHGTTSLYNDQGFGESVNWHLFCVYRFPEIVTCGHQISCTGTFVDDDIRMVYCCRNENQPYHIE